MHLLELRFAEAIVNEVAQKLSVRRLFAPFCLCSLRRLTSQVSTVHSQALPGVQISTVLQLCHYLQEMRILLTRLPLLCICVHTSKEAIH